MGQFPPPGVSTSYLQTESVSERGETEEEEEEQEGDEEATEEDETLRARRWKKHNKENDVRSKNTSHEEEEKCFCQLCLHIPQDRVTPFTRVWRSQKGCNKFYFNIITCKKNLLNKVYSLKTVISFQ